MSGYTLQIQIDTAGLQTIADAKMSVAILQPQHSSNYQIVALLMTPANTIYVTWSDSQLVYSSSYGLQAYTVLQINSQASALSGQIFSFNGSTITQSGTTDLPDTVQLANSSGSTITSGLARAFGINGTTQSPTILTASSLLPNGLGSFEIGNEIMLTLLGGAEQGMAIPSQVIPNFSATKRKARNVPQITAQAPLILNFSASNPSQTVHFDDQNAVFVAGSLT